MSEDLRAPMNHREIEYNAAKLSRCDIPDNFVCIQNNRILFVPSKIEEKPKDNEQEQKKELFDWLKRTGERVFDQDLIMDYGTDCLQLYLLFEHTPKEQDGPYYDSWQEGALEGLYKFLGRYRRVVLAAIWWNQNGGYKTDVLLHDSINRMEHALEDADTAIRRCIFRENTMSNRHRIVVRLMELVKILQKELNIAEILDSFHTHTIKTAVAYGSQEKIVEFDADNTKDSMRNNAVNLQVTKICCNLIILMTPYTPNLSKILWEQLQPLLKAE